MKVNIALVGGQAAPVFHVIDHYKPEKVVFIISDDKAVKKTYEAVSRECQVIGIRDIESHIVDPVDPTQLSELAAELFERYRNDRVIVNVSGGTKAMSHVFGCKFQGADNSTVVMIDQNNEILNFRSNTKEYYYGFDLYRNFRMNGNPLTNCTEFSKYTSSDLKVVDDVCKLWEKKKELLRPLAVMDDELKDAVSRKQKQFSCKRSYGKNGQAVNISWQMNDGGTEDTKVTLETSGVSYVFSSPNALDLVFNSGWFECHVARIISKWSKTKGEVLMNCRFPAKGKDFKNRQIDLNEVDVIVNAGTKPLLIECKTNISKPTDIDKFAKVIRNYGGLGSKGIFISLAPIYADRIEKCQKNNMAYFSLTQKTGNVEEKFYELLDNELVKLNSKA